MTAAGRSGGGWQVILADLALILFVAVAVQSVPANTRVPPRPAPPPPDAALAVWQGDGPGGLRQWLAMQAPDPRATLELRFVCPPPIHACLERGLPHDLDQAARRFGQLRITVSSGEVGNADARLVYN